MDKRDAVETLKDSMRKRAGYIADQLASEAMACYSNGAAYKAAHLMLAAEYVQAYDKQELAQGIIDAMPSDLEFDPDRIAARSLRSVAIGHATADIDYFQDEFMNRALEDIDEELHPIIAELDRGEFKTRSYRMPHAVIEQVGNDALIKTSRDYVVAHDYDAPSGTWGHGTYFGDDLVGAVCEAHGCEIRDGHERDGYVLGVDVDFVQSVNPDLTVEQAAEIAEMANDNLSVSSAFEDVKTSWVEAEIENFFEDGFAAGDIEGHDDPIAAAKNAAEIVAEYSEVAREVNGFRDER